MKRNSDPTLDSLGCLDYSNLAEDLSSHSIGSLTPNSSVSVSPLPTPLSEYFPELFLTWHPAFCLRENGWVPTKSLTVWSTRIQRGAATSSSSVFLSWALFDMVFGFLIQQNGCKKTSRNSWYSTNEEDGSNHHAWNYFQPTCQQVGSWCQHIWFGFLGSELTRSNNQSDATLWVLDTCLIVGLLPLMIILITASVSSKIFNWASNWEESAFVTTWSTFDTSSTSRFPFLLNLVVGFELRISPRTRFSRTWSSTFSFRQQSPTAWWVCMCSWKNATLLSPHPQ